MMVMVVVMLVFAAPLVLYHGSIVIMYHGLHIAYVVDGDTQGLHLGKPLVTWFIRHVTS